MDDDDDVNAETDEQTARLPMRRNMDRVFRVGFAVVLIMVTLVGIR